MDGHKGRLARRRNLQVPSRNMSATARERILSAFGDYMRDIRGYASTTRRRYNLRARAADGWLQDREMHRLPWASYREIRDYYVSTAASAGNRNDIRAALVSFYDFCIDQGWREDNPAKSLPRLRVQRPLPRALSIEECRRITAVSPAFGPMVESLMMLLLYAALRKSEARHLRWTDFSAGFTWLVVMGKGSKERSVPLHPLVTQALARWRTTTTSAEWVFPSERRRGEPIGETWFAILVNEVGEAAGIEHLQPHALRHSCATRLLETGASIKDVQAFLGHESVATTSIYLKARPENLAAAAGRLDFTRPTSMTPVPIPARVDVG